MKDFDQMEAPIETPARIEPCGIEEAIPSKLLDLTARLREASSMLGAVIDDADLPSRRAQLRITNSQYSNLIEGYDASPAEIAGALCGCGPVASDVAQLGAAHVRVEAWIDDLHARGVLPEPTSIAFIRELHHRLFLGVPAALRQGVTPGGFRGPDREVRVGNHIPPSSDRIGAFMAHYEMRYRGLTRGEVGCILSIPAAHHRLCYIHPFVDGNGRVARLVSYAMCLRAGIGGRGLWSISRALWCSDGYLMRMESADTPRRGDRDGRGNLSLSVLQGFTAWFLAVMLDEIKRSSFIHMKPG